MMTLMRIVFAVLLLLAASFAGMAQEAEAPLGIPPEVLARIEAGHVKQYRDYCLRAPFPRVGMRAESIIFTQFGRPIAKKTMQLRGERVEQWVFDGASSPCMPYILTTGDFLTAHAFLLFANGRVVAVEY